MNDPNERIPIGEARIVRDEVIAAAYASEGESGIYDWTAGRAYFAAWIETQRPRWRAEAEACIAHHCLQVYGDGVPARVD